MQAFFFVLLTLFPPIGESMSLHFRFHFFLCMLAFLSFLMPSNIQARVIGGGEMMDVDMEENLCALTFDDGPSIFTPQLLDMLKEYQIHATFFMLGKMVNNYKDITLRVAAEGHEIASHTYSHKNLKRLSNAKVLEEITRGYDSLAALGIIPTFLRPPYGSFDKRITEIANSFGMDVVLWSMDSLDWKRLPSDYGKIPSVRGNVYEEGEIRGVFLFHDIHKTTVDDLPRIVQELRRAGCQRFVTLSEYLQGVLDPEPALLMTRRNPLPSEQHEMTANVNATPQPVETTVTTPAVDENKVEQPEQETEESWISKTMNKLF